MAFNFNWSPLAADASFYQRARDLLTTALNKTPKPPIIVDDIIVTEFNLGSVPPDLEILEIGDIAADRFRGIFKMCYAGDAFLTLKTRVQVSFLSALPLWFLSPFFFSWSYGCTLSPFMVEWAVVAVMLCHDKDPLSPACMPTVWCKAASGGLWSSRCLRVIHVAFRLFVSSSVLASRSFKQPKKPGIWRILHESRNLLATGIRAKHPQIIWVVRARCFLISVAIYCSFAFPSFPFPIFFSLSLPSWVPRKRDLASFVPAHAASSFANHRLPIGIGQSPQHIPIVKAVLHLTRASCRRIWPHHSAPNNAFRNQTLRFYYCCLFEAKRAYPGLSQ